MRSKKQYLTARKTAVCKTLVFLISVLFLYPENGLYAQLPADRLAWSEAPLKWPDFKGSVLEGSPFDATVNSGISYSWSLRSSKYDTELSYTVATYFYPRLSWVRKGKMSQDLLSHEQLHFNITELHSRMLRKRMNTYSPDPKRNIKAELQKMYKEIENSRAKMQAQYDRETDHGQKEILQREWEARVTRELALLKKYSS